MPRWARTFVLLTGMLVWVVMVGVSLWLKQIPGAILVGFPAGLWVALNGRSTIARKRATQDEAVNEDEPKGGAKI
jgi:hypothetical protein